ncbi:MAG: DNA repair protein RecO [Gemmatimonadaceae bacterium]
MTLQVTDAVVLHTFDYLETSRIIRLATREAGVQSVIARGARRSITRFGAALDLFVSGVAEVQMKQGRELQQLTSFDITNARSALVLDLDRFASASMLCELALRCSAGEDHGDLFEALTAALDDVAAQSGAAARVEGLAAAWRVVVALGFGPAIDDCSNCHQVLSPDHPALFSHSMGGVTCATCETQVRGGRRLPVEARGALRAWINGLRVDLPDLPAQRAHTRLLREFVHHHVSEGVALRAFGTWAARFE